MEQHTCVLHRNYIGKSIKREIKLGKEFHNSAEIFCCRFTKTARTNGVTLFTKLFHQALDSIKLGLGLREFLAVLARVDGYQGPTFASALVMIFYPSNTFLRFSAAVLTFKLDFDIINNIGHAHLQRR